MRCQFGTDINGIEIYDDIDIVAYDLLCAGQEFTDNFCKCTSINRDNENDDVLEALSGILVFLYGLLALWVIACISGCILHISRKPERNGEVRDS